MFATGNLIAQNSQGGSDDEKLDVVIHMPIERLKCPVLQREMSTPEHDHQAPIGDTAHVFCEPSMALWMHTIVCTRTRTAMEPNHNYPISKFDFRTT